MAEDSLVVGGWFGSGLQVFSLLVVAYYILKLLRKALRRIYVSIVGPAIGRNTNLRKMGQWAVITGCTQGIGKAYAEALAKQGINVVLISRSLDKLQKLALEIEGKYHVQTKVIDADFTEGPPIYEKIEKGLFGLEIGVLINNVGMSYAYPEYFLDVKDARKVFADLINCNITSITHMTHVVLPQMIERKRGVVVNVSSTTAMIPSPLLSVYSASKAFVDKFTEDLRIEYARKGIVIQCVLPGYVATAMTRIKKSTFMAPFPNKFVSHAITSIGLEDRTTGYWPHNLLIMVVDFIKWIHPKMASNVILRTMENIRKRIIARGG
ncbi:very-long-chain 3-oxoacyl-CoA reductase [Cloeon dipterum]|uniref:very-long-chain 3-oxoacyl-CoA reductase n=1 Tax=Cloeon dipterum TaxID=197152 RepID=UPI00322023CB